MLATIVMALEDGQPTHCDVISEKGGKDEVIKAVQTITRDLYKGSLLEAPVTAALIGAIEGMYAQKPGKDRSRMVTAKASDILFIVMEREVHDVANPE